MEKTNPSMGILKDSARYLTHLLLERRFKNSKYSARAFARDLGLSAPFLSQVMSGQRKLSLEQKLKIASRLGLDANDAVEGLEQFNQKNKRSTGLKVELLQNTIEHELILKHWYHFAILEMTQTETLKANPRLIARRLGVSELEAKTAIERLIEFGYLEKTKQDILKKTKTPFLLIAKKSMPALKDLHQSRLLAAHEELMNTSEENVKARYFQTLFLATSKERVSQANAMMAAFQEKLIQFLVHGEQTKTENSEVYQLGMQLFSTEKKRK